MFLLTIFDFIARLHPVVVHLPIGILVLAVLFQWLTISNRYVFLQPAIPVTLFWGMIGAVVACISGYLLAQSGEYDDTITGRHQWFGISVAIFSVILYLLHKLSVRETIARWLSLVLLALVSITGHLGGTITHGEGYLTAAFQGGSGSSALKPIENPQEAFIYADIVQPILESKCYSCHGSSKQKGKLRLDSQESIMKGGENGKVVLPGKADESELIKRIFLPLGDDDHMPPEAKPQLTENEVLLLHWWVNAGADFTKKVKDLPATDKVKPAIAALKTGASGTAPENEDVPVEEVKKADDAIVNRLREAGVVVIPVAQNSNYLLANFVTAKNISDSILDLLTSLKEQLLWLRLDNTTIDDRALERISELRKLTRLQLNNTKITGAGIASLSRLEKLQSLNLVGTAVSADDVLKLKNLPALKHLYLYQTNVQTADWNRLKAAFPRAEIDTGKYVVPTLAADTTELTF